MDFTLGVIILVVFLILLFVTIAAFGRYSVDPD